MGRKPSIAEALPVELATTPNESTKRITETGEYEEDQDGVAKGFGNIHSEQVRINSIGEGAIFPEITLHCEILQTTLHN